MIENKPKVSTASSKYSKARQKEERILNLMKDYSGGISIFTINKLTNINHNTVKSIFKRLENKGVIKNNPSTPGYYVLVENPIHSMLFYNAQNVLLQVKSDKINLQKEIREINDLDGIIKFDLVIGAKSKKASFTISSPYPFNLTALSGYTHLFQEKMLRLCGFKPELDEIWVSTLEANKDYLNYRLDGINCITIRNAIADFKLYNKRNCVREECKTKVPVNAQFVNTLLQQGVTSSYYMQKIDRVDNNFNEIVKEMKKLKTLSSKILDKFSPLGDKKK
jgi:predicted transcriptional regulator